MKRERIIKLCMGTSQSDDKIFEPLTKELLDHLLVGNTHPTFRIAILDGIQAVEYRNDSILESCW
jgi:hypothetical protein